MNIICRKGKITPYIIGSLLLLVFIADLYIFRIVTGRPLGLTPSDLSLGPKINAPVQAAPTAPTEITPGEPFFLVPQMTFQPVESSNNRGIKVIGFGRAGNTLYLLVRLHETLDLSLKKGWGKAFQLIASNEQDYLYNSYSLPSGVQLYDPLVDLPDDLRGRQTVCPGGYKDLYLHFPNIQENIIPVRLRLIEAFQGDSPANPGIIYDEISFFPSGSLEEKPPVKALTALKPQPVLPKSITLINDNLQFIPKALRIDDNLFPQLTFRITGNVTDIILLDCVLIDRSGANYNFLQLAEKVIVNRETENRIMFERLPETAAIKSIWFRFSVDGIIHELLLNI